MADRQLAVQVATLAVSVEQAPVTAIPTIPCQPTGQQELQAQLRAALTGYTGYALKLWRVVCDALWSVHECAAAVRAGGSRLLGWP